MRARGAAMGNESRRAPGFDGAAAVTRSLLGYGVIAGGFYVLVGVVLALSTAGFELARHPLSLLMLGEHGWVQRVNLLLTGAMTLAAALGILRALAGWRAARRAAGLVGLYGVSLWSAAAFPPDPMEGFPPGTAPVAELSASGLGHLLAGAVGFVAISAAAALLGGWFRDRGRMRAAVGSRVAAAVVVVGFLAGAALATTAAGTALLWLAVLVGWAWLAAVSVTLYRVVPHPDPHRRLPQTGPDETAPA
jgi:hypothetical protein